MYTLTFRNLRDTILVGLDAQFDDTILVGLDAQFDFSKISVCFCGINHKILLQMISYMFMFIS